MKKILLALIVCYALSSTMLYAASLRTMDYTGDTYANSSNLLATSDGGRLMIGSTIDLNDATNGDVTLIKTNSAGTVVWSGKYSLPNYTVPLCTYSVHRQLHAIDAIETSTSYVILATVDMKELGWPLCGPNSWYFQAETELLFIRVEKTGGNPQIGMTSMYQKAGSQIPYELMPTQDGGYMMCSFTKAGAPEISGLIPVFTKFSSNFTVQWSKKIDNFVYEVIIGVLDVVGDRFPITQLSDGSFVLAASTGPRTFFMRLNANGTVAWQKYLDHSTYFSQVGEDWGIAGAGGMAFRQLQVLPNGNIACFGNIWMAIGAVLSQDAGSLSVTAGGYLELNSSGVPQKAQIFSYNTGASTGTLYACSVSDAKVIANDKIMLTGIHHYAEYIGLYNPQAANDNFFTWCRQIPKNYHLSKKPNGYDAPHIQVVSNNCYMSTVDNDLLEVEWQNPQAGSLCLTPLTMAGLSLPVNPLFTSTMTLSDEPLGTLSYPSITMSSLGATSTETCGTLDIADPTTTTTIELAPNPAHNRQTTLRWNAATATDVAVQVYNIQGSLVYHQTFDATQGANQHTLQLPHTLAAGSYFVQLVSAQGTHTAKLLVP
jgi:hypothetical protein